MTEDKELFCIEADLLSELGGKPRLDQCLCKLVPDFSRARLQKLIEDGMVELNGKRARAGAKPRVGDIVALVVPEAVPLDVVAENIPLDIIYEDEHLLVINKPAGMVTHPGAGIYSGTLVNAVMYHAGERLSSIGGVVRPGIVHRLDKDTSGLIMVAKTDLAHNSLAEQLKAKTAGRNYLALLEGKPKEREGTIDIAIGRHPVRRKEMTVFTDLSRGEGKRAVTHFTILENYHNFALAALALETGRTHQIRVHMSYLGLPVVGDLVYNHKTSGSQSARKNLGLLGHALHAHKLRFTHPVDGKLLEFEANLPADFQNLLLRLQEKQ